MLLVRLSLAMTSLLDAYEGRMKRYARHNVTICIFSSAPEPLDKLTGHTRRADGKLHCRSSFRKYTRIPHCYFSRVHGIAQYEKREPNVFSTSSIAHILSLFPTPQIIIQSIRRHPSNPLKPHHTHSLSISSLYLSVLDR